jgi:hypothetical protein
MIRMIIRHPRAAGFALNGCGVAHVPLIPEARRFVEAGPVVGRDVVPLLRP